MESYEKVDPEEARRFIEEEIQPIESFEERLDRFDEWSLGKQTTGSAFVPLVYIIMDEYFND